MRGIDYIIIQFLEVDQEGFQKYLLEEIASKGTIFV